MRTRSICIADGSRPFSIAITASLISDQLVWLTRILVKPALYVIAAGVTVLWWMFAGKLNLRMVMYPRREIFR